MIDRLDRTISIEMPEYVLRERWWEEGDTAEKEDALMEYLQENLSGNQARFLQEQCLFLLDLQRNLLRIRRQGPLEQEDVEVSAVPSITYESCSSVWMKWTITEIQGLVWACIYFSDGFHSYFPGQDQDRPDGGSVDMRNLSDEGRHILTIGNYIIDALRSLSDHNNIAIDQEALSDLYSSDSPSELFHKMSNADRIFKFSCFNLSIDFAKKANGFRKIYTILHELNEKIRALGLAPIDSGLMTNTVNRCTAIARLEYACGKTETKLALSGPWDNNLIYAHKSKITDIWGHQITLEEKTNELLRQLIDAKSIPPMDWCRLDNRINSYIIRNHSAPSYSAPSCMSLSELTKQSPFRTHCFKKHYSCCERKIIASLPDNNHKIKKITFYVTKKPCVDCTYALNALPYRHIVVNYEDQTETKRHCPDSTCEFVSGHKPPSLRMGK